MDKDEKEDFDVKFDHARVGKNPAKRFKPDIRKLKNKKIIAPVVVILILIVAIGAFSTTGSLFGSDIEKLENELNETKAYYNLCTLNLQECRGSLDNCTSDLEKESNSLSACNQNLDNKKQIIAEKEKEIEDINNSLKDVKKDYSLLTEELAFWKCCTVGEVMEGNELTWSIDSDANAVTCGSGEFHVNCGNGKTW